MATLAATLGARSVVREDRATEARAFVEHLFAAHHAEIYNYLARMLRNEDLAADVAQETFIKAYRAFETLEDPGRARPWLYQIASRTALDELRRRRIIRFVSWSGESRGTAASAEEVVLGRRLSAELERALAAIPDRQRNALLLAELGEMSGPELAVALGVKPDAARALLTRARESLRKALAAEQAGRAAEESRSAERRRLEERR